MNLPEFSALNKLEQSRLVSSAKWISSKKSGNTIIVLYKIDQFYVEGFYNWQDMHLFDLKSDLDNTTIESYAATSHINPLTREAYRSVFAPVYDQRFVM